MGDYLADKIAPVSDYEIERGLAFADAKLLSCGITSLQDASSANDLHQWKRLSCWKVRDLVRPHITMMMGLNGMAESQRDPFTSEIDPLDLRAGGAKIIVSRTTGTLHPSREELNETVLAIHAAGRQAVIHAIEGPEIEAACYAI